MNIDIGYFNMMKMGDEVGVGSEYRCEYEYWTYKDLENGRCSHGW